MGATDLDIDGILVIIDNALKDFSFDYNLDTILKSLCMMAVVFQTGKVAVQNIARVGEGFSLSSLGTPFMSILMIAAWPTLASFILDASNGIAHTVVVKQELVTKKNQDSYKKLDLMIAAIEAKNKKMNQAIATNNSFLDIGFESLGNEIESFSDKMGLRLAKMCLSIVTVIDAFLYVCFYFIAKLWLKFVLLGGSIAFTISVLTGGWTNLINWAKTVVSVSLWLPVTGLMLELINTVMIDVFESLNSGIDSMADGMDQGTLTVVLLSKFLDTLIVLLSVTIAFIGLKLIMLAKVPSIISTWISGGGGAASGGFAMGFIPAAMGASAARSVVSTTVSAGASAVQSFKK